MSALFISGIVLAVFIVVTTCFGVVNNRTDGKFKVAEIGFMAFAIPSVFLGVSRTAYGCPCTLNTFSRCNPSN